MVLVWFYHPPPPPPPPPPPEEPPLPPPELEPGAEEDEEMADERELPKEDAKPAVVIPERAIPEYQAGE